jgi:UDP-N-acetylmuramate dehydrogenase
LRIQDNISLKPFNTFGIEVFAKKFVEVHSVEDVLELLPILQNEKYIFLGGGSNVLFQNNFDGLVVLNRIYGKTFESKDQLEFKVSASSGESWHEFVLWTIDQGYYGMENMSLIPGTVGAAPMQNIGAYGVEIKDYCESVEAINLSNGDLVTFTNDDCQFGYRESIFKRELKDQFFITKVNFKLSTKNPLQMKYGTIAEELKKNHIENPTHKDVSNAVIAIRNSKLPNPSILGNAGSFFKNPVIDQAQAEMLKQQYPEMPVYPSDNGTKIPAGWLIEKTGWKGKQIGNVGCHKDQALVIVNYGGADGQEIYNHSTKIIDSIQQVFGIRLEREVNMIS